MPIPQLPRPKVPGGKRPEPFHANDERRCRSAILHSMCRLAKRCFSPAEVVMEKEMEGAGAYHNPEAKEKALYDKPNEYYNIVSYCLERLLERKLVVKEKRIDESDDTQYVVYCKTKLLK